MLAAVLIGLGGLLLAAIAASGDEPSDHAVLARGKQPSRGKLTATEEPPEIPLLPPELPIDLPEPPHPPLLPPEELPPLPKGGKVIQLPTQVITASPAALARAKAAKAAAARAKAAKAAAAQQRPPAPAPSSPASRVPAVQPPRVAPPKPAAVPAAKPAPAPSSPARDAARALDALIASGGRDRSKIASLQWQMGLDADGIPGMGTRNKVTALLGAAPKWAALSDKQVQGPIPGGSSKREAAERLERYWGIGGRRKERIAAYQRVLGTTPDGVMGPKTRAAADAALGRKAQLAA